MAKPLPADKVAAANKPAALAPPPPMIGRTWLCLALIFITAVALRVYHLGDAPLWLDEVYSVESAMGRGFSHRLLPPNTLIEHVDCPTDPSLAAPWWQLPRSTLGPAGDVHPPLPYLILRGWFGVFGVSDVTARSLSVVASLAGLLLFFAVARELHGPTVALWACAIMAVAQQQVAFAQEAKHYALLQAFALAGALAVVRLATRGPSPSRAVTLGLATLTLLFTHYFSVAVIAALGLYALIGLRGRPRRDATIAIIAAGAAFAALWLPSVIAQAHEQRSGVDFFLDRDPGFFARWTDRTFSATYRLIADPLPDSMPVAYGASVLLVLPAILVWRGRRDLLLWAIWLPCTLGFVALLDLVRHTWLMALTRYVLVAGPAVFALLAAIPPPRLGWRRHALAALVAVACLPFLPNAWHAHQQDARRLAALLLERAKPGDVTIVTEEEMPEMAYARYVTLMHYARRLPGPLVILTGPADPHLMAQLRARGRCLLVGGMLVPSGWLPGGVESDKLLVNNSGSVTTLTFPRTATAPSQP